MFHVICCVRRGKLEEDLLATGVGISPWPEIGAHDRHGILRAEGAGQAGGPRCHVHDFCRGSREHQGGQRLGCSPLPPCNAQPPRREGGEKDGREQRGRKRKGMKGTVETNSSGFRV